MKPAYVMPATALLLLQLGGTPSNSVERELLAADLSVATKSSACDVAAASAYKRCAATCSASGIAFFSPGICGAGSICQCGGDGVPRLPIEPEEK